MRKYSGMIRSALGILLVVMAVACAALADEAPAMSRKGTEAAQAEAAPKKKKEKMKIQGDTLVYCTLSDATVTVPDGVRVIGSGAFEKLDTLKKVILPDSVEKIEKRAFAECVKLKKVVLGAETRLKKIGKKAFLNCRKLNKSFVPDGVKVAQDAFEGVPEPGETPEPTPEPTPAPYGGGGGGGGHVQPHSMNTVPEGPDYDLVDLDGIENAEPMEQLTLGMETLDLALSREDRSGFTLSAISWQEAGKDPASESLNTLILTAAGADNLRSVWKLNGAVLRRMHKSGIDHLVLRTGNRIVVMNTEGVLAGWAYEELKSRGAGSRWFDFEIEMDGQSPAVWRVRVEGRLYELTEDSHAGIFLAGSYSGTADVLERPYSITSAGAGAPAGRP